LTSSDRQGDPDIGEQPLADVAAAHDAVRAAERRLRRAVLAARAAGQTWAVIGQVLGTSRQAAYQRFGRGDEPDARPPLAGAAERTVDVLVELAHHRWATVCDRFTERMATSVDAERLATAWTSLSDNIGRYEGTGSAFVRRVGTHTLVDLPVRCEAGEALLRVAYDDAARIAGLFLLPPDQ